MKSLYTLSADGFYGRFLPGDRYPRHAVLVLPGTGTGEENALKQFGYFHTAGYSVLFLAHSIWGGELPADPIQVPLEQAQLAIHTLKAGGYAHIAVFGLSFGARYALLAACELSDFEVVIAASPYDYITEAVKGMLKPLNCSVHRYQGRDYPYLPIRALHKCLPLELIRFFRNPHYDLSRILRYGYDSCVELEEARIPVERIQAEVLLLAPTWDSCWPSEQAVPRMAALLAKSQPQRRLKTVLYPHGNHILAVDLDATPDRKQKMQSFLKEQGGSGSPDTARKESIQEVLDFLQPWAERD